MKPLVIVGAGGFGRETRWLVDEINKAASTWNVLGFLDDNPQQLAGFPQFGSILGPVHSYQQLDRPWVVCAVYDPRVRLDLVNKLAVFGPRWATLIHPLAVIGTGSSVQEGSILARSSTVTTNVSLGKHTIVNIAATIGHDARIADFCTLSSHVDVCGAAQLEEGVFVGSHASILQKATVKSWARVGAGSVVLRRVEAGSTVVGVPAREIKRQIPARE